MASVAMCDWNGVWLCGCRIRAAQAGGIVGILEEVQHEQAASPGTAQQPRQQERVLDS